MGTIPIADYALLSDCRSAALVSRGGSVDWLCFPRFDGPAMFARLLDERAGHWSIRTVDQAQVRRGYVGATMAVETTSVTATGTAILVDALAVGRNERGHQLGLDSPGVLLRQATCVRGVVEFVLECAPRPEYGLVHPLLSAVEGGVMARGGASRLLLSLPIASTIEDGTIRAGFTLRAGEQVHFALEHRAAWEPIQQVWTQAAIGERLMDTLDGWRSWSAIHQAYEGPWRDLVHTSGRVLQALTYQPTGAIVAAPTTSLPESVGGGRNWDYRYAWVRDACFTMDALWIAACPDEAHRFFGWMAGTVAGQLRGGAPLQIMFGVGGEHDLSERELAHLSGWRGSRPVRVGNGAWEQPQLDVYGELLGAARRLAGQLTALDDVGWRFLVEAADAAAEHWNEPDQGIWEVRGEPRHFLYSKLMCWSALDSAIALADQLHAQDRVAVWRETAAAIRQAIVARGWSDRAGAFTQAFDSDELDASALVMPIVGFLPGNDPRVRATVAAIAARLTDARGLVYRYRSQDGLAGEEGTFLLCTFWLAQAQALIGDTVQARATFERAVAYVNDVGLLAEEIDPATGEFLGNFPQAFSHLGLINAAWAISLAEQGHVDTATRGPAKGGGEPR